MRAVLGQQVSVAAATTFAGRIVDISPIAQETENQSLRRAFRAEVLMEESDPSTLRPGMSVRVEVLLPPRRDVLIVASVSCIFGLGSPDHYKRMLLVINK